MCNSWVFDEGDNLDREETHLSPSTGERVVLARRTTGFQPYQWTGAEPEGPHDEDEARALGAVGG